MPKRTCVVDDCDRPVYGHGWCSLHWKRWRKHGDPAYVWAPVKAICSVDDCDQSVNGHGLCSMHYKRWRKHGDPTHERRQGRPPCVVNGCDLPNVGRGWCVKHYTRWIRYGSPTARMRGEVVDGKRICPRCGQDLPVDNFPPPGSYCEPCGRMYSRAKARWRHMIARCTDPAHKSWKDYGGRGITICVEWMDFRTYYADTGDKPAPGMSLDRIDNDGNYEPSNIRWATHSEQMKNRRPQVRKVARN